jgi:peptide/bleomycin uptake transporter
LFHSFFPRPKVFFGSFILWTFIAIGIWFELGRDVASAIGLPLSPPNAEPVIGLGYFVTNDSIFFYSYFLLCIALFGGIWHLRTKDNPWKRWSIWGTAFIVFTTYLIVDINVALTYWRGPQYNMLVEALKAPNTVPASKIYFSTLIFFQLASLYVLVAVIQYFVTSHYLFRWRNAMNDFYYSKWKIVRTIEGASQRIQEDTMRFSRTMEDLGTSLMDSFMTLIAYLPLLAVLSAPVKELPIVGEIPFPLVTAAIFWSIFGTLLMIVAGIKLPGLEFQNQRVEAAFRKELVYGEDDPLRAQPGTVKDLFGNVRKNNFRMFWHYGYFNMMRFFYLQTDAIFPTMVMVPSVSAAVITFGTFEQIRQSFGQVTNSFQYLINSWPTMVELISIHKRLQAFERAMKDQPLPSMDREFIAAGEAENF